MTLPGGDCTLSEIPEESLLAPINIYKQGAFTSPLRLLDLLNLLCLSSAISSLGEVDEKVCQWQKVANIDHDSQTLSRCNKTVGKNQVGNSQGCANQELRDLHACKIALARGVEANGSEGIVGVHDSMNKRVEGSEQPDGSCLVANT